MFQSKTTLLMANPWATLLKGAVKNTGSIASNVGKSISHPAQTIKSATSLTKGAVLTGGGAYLAWENLVKDKPLVDIAEEKILGRERSDDIKETVSLAVEKVSSTIKDTKSTITDVKDAAEGTKNIFSGITDFIKNAFSGSGGDMMSNFFSNVLSGKVTGGSIVSLLLAGFMVFGKFGWMGKIGGALLAMMLIGNNSKREEKKEKSLNPIVNEEEIKSQVPASLKEDIEQERTTIHRERLDENELEAKRASYLHR